MAKTQKKSDISKLNFEQAVNDLTQIVGRIEQGQIPLQDSIEQYERGMGFIKHCQKILKTAEKRIEKISDSEASDEDES